MTYAYILVAKSIIALKKWHRIQRIQYGTGIRTRNMIVNKSSYTSASLSDLRNVTRA